MAPMRQRRNDQAIDVSKNRLHRLASFRRRGWQLRFEITGLNLRQHRQIFDTFEVIRDPVDDLMTEAAEFFGGHVAEGWGLIRFNTYRHATSPLLQGLFKHSSSVNHCGNCHGVMLNAVDDAITINEALPKALILEFRHNAT